MKIEIPKPHLLNNPAFVKPVLQTALRLLLESNNTEKRPYDLAVEIVEDLGLPENETVMVSNAIAPRFAAKCTLDFLRKALARLESSKPIVTQISKSTFSDLRPQQTFFFSLNDVKEKLFELLEQYRIVTGDFVYKRLSRDFERAHCTLKALELSCSLNEACWIHSDIVIVSAPGIEPSKESLIQQLLSENGHKPFNINILADRFCMSTEQTIKWLKERRFGSLFLWSPYDVWSIADIPISQDRLLEIQRFVKSRNNNSILLDDAFDWVVRGTVARNLYPEIYVESKVSAVTNAFGLAGVNHYLFDRTTKKFVSKIRKEQTLVGLAPLYKPLWEDE